MLEVVFKAGSLLDVTKGGKARGEVRLKAEPWSSKVLFSGEEKEPAKMEQPMNWREPRAESPGAEGGDVTDCESGEGEGTVLRDTQ